MFVRVNGGRPQRCVFEGADTGAVLSHCCELTERRGGALWTYDLIVREKRLVPPHFFPFALDVGGDILFADCSTTNGKVFIYVHDTAFEHVRDLGVGIDEFWSRLVPE